MRASTWTGTTARAAAPPGCPSPEKTITRYEQFAGRPMRHMHYYEVLSALKFTAVIARIGQLFINYEMVPPTMTSPTTNNNTASQLLAKTPRPATTRR